MALASDPTKADLGISSMLSFFASGQATRTDVLLRNVSTFKPTLFGMWKEVSPLLNTDLRINGEFSFKSKIEILQPATLINY
jgi:hypothetical protein